MKLFHMSLLLAGGVLIPLPGAAGDDNIESRYTMEKTEEGIVRLDRKTGAMTLCSIDNAQLACRMAADERTTLEREIDLLSDRVSTLEKSALQLPLARLPPDEELERSMSFMEKVLKHFMGTVQALEKSQEHQAFPQKT